MIVKDNTGGPQASGMNADFNKLSATGLLEFATWYRQNSVVIAEEYTDCRGGRDVTLNEFALWLYQEYPQRVGFLNQQAQAERLFDSVVECEFEDMACDPEAGSAPYMSSATVREDGLERTLDANELECINEFCEEGVQEWFFERYA